MLSAPLLSLSPACTDTACNQIPVFGSTHSVLTVYHTASQFEQLTPKKEGQFRNLVAEVTLQKYMP